MGNPIMDVVGGMFAGFGIIQERGDQANAYLDDIATYDRQIQYVTNVGKRKLNLLEQDQKTFLGRKKAMFAKAGVGFDSTVLNSLAGDRVEQITESAALQAETEQNLRDLRTKRSQASARADSLLDPWNTFVSVLGGVMPAASSAVQGVSNENVQETNPKGINYRSKY